MLSRFLIARHLLHLTGGNKIGELLGTLRKSAYSAIVLDRSESEYMNDLISILVQKL